MKELHVIENPQKWLKRNKVDDSSTDTGDSQKKGTALVYKGK